MKTEAKTFLTNPAVDMIMAGGLSLLLFPVFLMFAGLHRSPEMIRLAAGLGFAVNYPHFAATVYRLYHNQENRLAYPFTVFVLPFLFIGLFLAALRFPDSFGGYYCKAFLIWSGYHYSGQTLGISLIYARRSNFPIAAKARWLLTAAIYSTYLFPILRADTSPDPRPFFGISVPSFHLPPVFAHLAQNFLTLSWAGLLTYVVLAPRYSQGRRIPFPVLVPILAQFFWYIPGSNLPNFYELVPLFHGLQYLLIVWVFQMKEQREAYEKAGREFSGGNFRLENLKYFAAIIFLGALLFRFIPDSITLAGIPLKIAEPLWIATVQLHHFWTDGVIWRLRKPNVGKRLLVTDARSFAQAFRSPRRGSLRMTPKGMSR